MSTLLPSLVRRLDRAQESGRGLNLTAEDIDALVATGAYRTLADAAIRQKEDQCRARHARTLSISGEPSSFTPPEMGAATLKSSGTMKPDSGNEALPRALAASGKGA